MSDAAMTPAMTPVTSSGALPPPFGAATHSVNNAAAAGRPPVAPKPKPASGAAPAAAASAAATAASASGSAAAVGHPDRIRVLTHNGSISSDDSED